jgi:hypothetical protein
VEKLNDLDVLLSQPDAETVGTLWTGASREVLCVNAPSNELQSSRSRVHTLSTEHGVHEMEMSMRSSTRKPFRPEIRAETGDLALSAPAN